MENNSILPDLEQATTDMTTSAPAPHVKEELTEYLRSRLIECGWRDQVASMCRSMIQENGVENVRLEQMVGEVRSQARQLVPDTVKTEALAMIRKLDSKQASQQQQHQPMNIT